MAFVQWRGKTKLAPWKLSTFAEKEEIHGADG
jgi:hypothetical protein